MPPDETRAFLEWLYGEHRQAAFPSEPELRSEPVAGVDLVLLDADVAGCVGTWIGKRGSLDPWRKDMVAKSIADLDRVIPLLPEGSPRQYFDRLRLLATTVSSAS